MAALVRADETPFLGGGQRQLLPPIQRHPHQQHRRHDRSFLDPVLSGTETAVEGASPGQMAKALLRLKLIADATQRENRNMLQEGFGVAAPEVNDAERRGKGIGKKITGTMTK